MAALICAIDFETTGLIPGEHHIIEVGAALLDPNTWEVLSTLSAFVNEPRALPLDPKIQELTGITEDNIRTGAALHMVLAELRSFTSKCTAFMAHNASFDKAFLEAAWKDTNQEAIKLPWYCSKGDVRTHAGKNCTKLSHLAIDYGLSVDASKLHRALDDVKLMARMLAKTGLTFNEIKEYADDPWVYLAMTKGKFDEEANEKAKRDGYGWQKCIGTYGPIFQKRWVKRVKSKDLPTEQAKDPGFKREVIREPTE